MDLYRFLDKSDDVKKHHIQELQKEEYEDVRARTKKINAITEKELDSRYHNKSKWGKNTTIKENIEVKHQAILSTLRLNNYNLQQYFY